MQKILLEDVQIKNLADHQEYIAIISSWLWQEWSDGDGTTIDDVERRTRGFLGKDRIPMTFIAMHGNVPVGTYSLWPNDLLVCRRNMKPWLAALYVVVAYRNIGLGQLMQRYAIKQAKMLGYRFLYLTTHHRGYYEKSGWSFLFSDIGSDEKMNRIYRHRVDI